MLLKMQRLYVRTTRVVSLCAYSATLEEMLHAPQPRSLLAGLGEWPDQIRKTGLIYLYVLICGNYIYIYISACQVYTSVSKNSFICISASCKL